MEADPQGEYVELVAEALRSKWLAVLYDQPVHWHDMATAAIAAMEPALIEARNRARAEAFEEAAKAMENLAFFTDVDELLGMTKQEMSVRTCREGATAIRALAGGEG